MTPRVPDEDRQTRKALSSYAQAGAYIGSGMQFAATIALGLFAGWWLDERLSTTPLFLIAGTILGAVAGFIYLYRNLTRGTDESTEMHEHTGESD